MNRNQIIESLYNDERFNDCISKMEPESLREDLKSEVILIMLGQPEEKLISMFKKDELINYAVRIVVNTVKYTKSDFYKTYRIRTATINTNLPEETTEADRFLREASEGPVYDLLLEIKKIAYQQYPKITYIKELEDAGINFYMQYMLSLYMKEGTYRAMEKEIKKYNNWIDHDSCHKTIKKAIELLKQYVTPRINNTLLAGICLLCSRGDAA